MTCRKFTLFVYTQGSFRLFSLANLRYRQHENAGVDIPCQKLVS